MMDQLIRQVITVWFIVTVSAVYFTPSVVALVRARPNLTAIVLCNLVFGWTGIGWVLALAMASKRS